MSNTKEQANFHSIIQSQIWSPIKNTNDSLAPQAFPHTDQQDRAQIFTSLIILVSTAKLY